MSRPAPISFRMRDRTWGALTPKCRQVSSRVSSLSGPQNTQRQATARDAIATHLDTAVGKAGGPIDEAKRTAWVKALREISEAALDVTR